MNVFRPAPDRQAPIQSNAPPYRSIRPKERRRISR